MSNERRDAELRAAIRNAIRAARDADMSPSSIVNVIERETAALRRRLPAGKRRSRRGAGWERFSDRIATRIAARYGESL
jgi:hypothetical protein